MLTRQKVTPTFCIGSCCCSGLVNCKVGLLNCLNVHCLRIHSVRHFASSPNAKKNNKNITSSKAINFLWTTRIFPPTHFLMQYSLKRTFRGLLETQLMKAALLLALKSVPPSLSLAGHSELLRLTIPPPVFTRSHPRVSRGRSLTRNPARSLVQSAFKIGAPCWDLGADGPRTSEQISKSNRWQRAHRINELLFPFHLFDYTTQL